MFPWKQVPAASPAAERRAQRMLLRARRHAEPAESMDVKVSTFDVGAEVTLEDTCTADEEPTLCDPTDEAVIQPVIYVPSSTRAVQTDGDPLLSIEQIRHHDSHVLDLTGLESYRKFQIVLRSLGPAAYDLEYRWGKPTNITLENQFFLTLLKLRKHYSNKELSIFFSVSEKSVANIFVTWINFMYCQWKELSIWPDRDLVEFFSPPDFQNKFPHTRTIVDGAEIPIKRPRNPDTQQQTWSTYKHQNTLKVLVGCTPGGLINYVSDAWGGSASDRLLCERSDLMTICDPGDRIMADKGFNVQDIFAHYDVGINIPTFMTGKNQLSTKALARDRKISSKRVLVERGIGLAKTYKILCGNPMNDVETALGSRVIYVCFMLCNFRSSLVSYTR